MPGKMARSGPQRQLDGLEYRELAGPSVLCLPAIQKIPNFHVSSGFIWKIPINIIWIWFDGDDLCRDFEQLMGIDADVGPNINCATIVGH